jgi:hypothetical protein
MQNLVATASILARTADACRPPRPPAGQLPTVGAGRAPVRCATVKTYRWTIIAAVIGVVVLAAVLVALFR